ncbi:MAG: carbohydrate ABC transporter permease, partial [Lachnospiraceae bacterium]|nr:carbohydrate ABC transporter permease [Lachnospiraceae bacterium]
MKKNKNKIKQGMDDKVFGLIIKILVLVILVVTLYPLIYVFSMAISDPYRAAAGDVVLFPKGIDFTAIKTVLNDSQLYRYYYNTIWYTVVGTVLGVVVTMLAAYPLSRNTFSAKGIVTIFFVLTMFLNAGLIPRYIVNVKFLHLYNTRWVL